MTTETKPKLTRDDLTQLLADAYVPAERCVPLTRLAESDPERVKRFRRQADVVYALIAAARDEGHDAGYSAGHIDGYNEGRDDA